MSVQIHTHADRGAAIKAVAQEIASLVRTKPNAVLGLATGATPIPLYQELVRMHREEGLSFAQVTSFNLDEYQGIPREHAESYWTFMHQIFFDHIDIDPSRINLPGSQVPVDDMTAHCATYEAKIVATGGIDYQILGIGRTGHIGFNEPGSPADCITREIHLDEITRQDAVPAFGGIDQVPTSAITMGCGTILAAKKIALMAFGEKKADIVRKALQEPITDLISASFLRNHPNAAFHLDPEAASVL
ncbi:MAG TPA: glucosamine-6-phosphate deaminase [Verrucomicrobiales bacterium]|nr:MAG: glucosamine-6-phosphate deaminase [Verrucomicrobiae bacterium Tous-C3TDCM]PAZ04921.1 MAG: glucosamine-6-phosphate deaminase [Verrucomicrobiae bacterium AMD-G2]HBE23810.1 glucosamine-6-phosphate deaminase [Verrucomicrobiales bacterium]